MQPRDLKKTFSKDEYDLLVIGGGINGAAIANIAAGEGMSVALVEKEDFAGGTSSRSTKLIHGGLRYLENLELDLVQESLRERYIQWKSAPYLVRPLRFVIPVYKRDRRPLWMIKLGVSLYDLLSGKYIVEKHASLTSEEVLQAVPGLRKEGLVGGVAYSDCGMDDSRLCLENILMARERGAHAANYALMESFLKVAGTLTAGAEIRDVLTGEKIVIRAHHVVCAVGPWTNEVLKKDTAGANDKIRLTKGVHVIYKDKISDSAILLQAGRDNRVFFVIPFENHSLIGTTDTDYSGSADEVESGRDDIDYLLNEAARFFPGRKFCRENIVTDFAGLRPLVFAPGNPSEISRKHVIEKNSSGVWYVMGGKYTTYRAMAAECVEKVQGGKKLKSGAEYPLYGSAPASDQVGALTEQSGLGDSVCKYLFAKYGNRAEEILAMVVRDRALGEPLCGCSPAIKAQVVYAIEKEMAVTADDIIWRRLGIGYRYCETKNCRKIISEYLTQ